MQKYDASCKVSLFLFIVLAIAGLSVAAGLEHRGMEAVFADLIAIALVGVAGGFLRLFKGITTLIPTIIAGMAVTVRNVPALPKGAYPLLVLMVLACCGILGIGAALRTKTA